ncbi:hypothetical protein EV128_103257 [Rhizobium azibense]|nr:hypothetical protein EV128_103257 [Rhizobium azibense]
MFEGRTVGGLERFGFRREDDVVPAIAKDAVLGVMDSPVVGYPAVGASLLRSRICSSTAPASLKFDGTI